MGQENKILNRAKYSTDTDEWYTSYDVVSDELEHYIEWFRGKSVYSNCDDPNKSSFVQWFLENFNRIGLGRFVCTSRSVGADKRGTIMSVTNIGAGFRKEEHITSLSGDGDMFSDECLGILDGCDLLVTNPPFSRFIDLFRLLRDSGKGYLLVANQNAATYRDVFPEIIEGRCWIGYRFGDMSFRVPDSTEPRPTRFWVDDTGQKWRSLGNAMWLTNIGFRHSITHLVLSKQFNPDDYPKYDNFDAINVRRVSDIPSDYDGLMGVPVTFLKYYDCGRFEIVGQANHGSAGDDYDLFKPLINGKEQFKRLLIRRKR